MSASTLMVLWILSVCAILLIFSFFEHWMIKRYDETLNKSLPALLVCTAVLLAGGIKAILALTSLLLRP